ncbi:hypothetical protein EDB89DRAFT_1912533 [Lactarius sanguifluus]|nr:hypothetical protein EDB89DRAFT_1912533 [Lactarius sanguifluus]
MLLSHGPKCAGIVFLEELLGHLGHKRNTWWDEFIRAFTAAWINETPVHVPVGEDARLSPPPRPPRSPRRPVSPRVLPPTQVEDDDWTLFAPRSPASTPPSPVLAPLVTPAASRVEKRKHHDTPDEEETRPNKYLRIAPHAGPPRARPQPGRRSVPLPKKLIYRQRRAASAPTTGIPPFLVPYSPPPRRPPSPPEDPRPAPPLLDPDPRPLAQVRTVVEDDNTLTGGVKTLDVSVFAPVSARDDAGSTPHTSDSCPQTPLLTPDAADSPPRTPTHASPNPPEPTKVEDDFDFEAFYDSYLDDNGLTRADDHHQNVFPRHALEMPRDPDELVTKTSNRQRRDSTRVPYPTTPRNHDRPAQNAINHRPEDVPPTPVASQHMRKRRRANAAAAPPHSPGVATNAQPVDHRTRRRTTDLRSNSLDGTPAEPDSHAKPQQARPHRTPERKHIRAETTEATPAINRANAAVEMFLRRYDAARPTPAPAAAPASRAYDAIAQHLAYRLATDPDTTRVTQPFALRPGPRAVLLRRKKK